MLNLYPQYVAWHYFLLILAAALVVIQAAASQSGLAGLQIGGRLWPKKWSFFALIVVVIGSVSWFIYSTPDYISPGLAGSELLFVFAAAVALAFLISVLGGLFCTPSPRVKIGLPKSKEAVAGHYRCEMMLPAAQERGLSIIFPDPDLPESLVYPQVKIALEQNYTCAFVSWERNGFPDYPAALAIAPLLISSWQAKNGQHLPVILIGSGIAADLVLRSACDDQRVTKVFAIAPAFSPKAVLTGLLLLRELSMYWVWRRRSWQRQGFIKAMRSGEALSRLGERALILLSERDGFLDSTAFISVEASAHLIHLSKGTHCSLMREQAPAVLDKYLHEQVEADVAILG